MRAEAGKVGDVNRMQAWSGQSAGLAKAIPAAAVLNDAWDGARALIEG